MVMYKIPDRKEHPFPSGAVASKLDEAEAAQSGFMTSSASAPNPNEWLVKPFAQSIKRV
jgi:hypothetical protein